MKNAIDLRNIVSYILDKKWWLRSFRLWIQKFSHIKNNDICLISNNCIGGIIAHDLGLIHNSPTVNVFFFAPDYIKFLKYLPEYITAEMYAAKTSRFGNFEYPIGILKDIELHFPHNRTFEEAKEKWIKRGQRMDGKRLFVIASDRDLCTPELIKDFDHLPYPNKIFFSSRPYPQFKSVIYFPEYKHLPEVPDMIPTRQWLKRINIIAWLNSGM